EDTLVLLGIVWTCIMDIDSPQEIMIMMHGIVIVLKTSLVPGGIINSLIQILMVSTLILQLLIIKELLRYAGKIIMLLLSSQRRKLVVTI
uniref:Uncharacterized protein n=1 Tax=Amphimedon queenslandica TaxID=400682 RepID=A0A1X7TSM8_AMPQE